VVEHDFIMATYLADRVIVYEGTPGQKCTARSPVDLVPGMNLFLATLDVTFRRDPKNYRPRVNKVKCKNQVKLIFLSGTEIRIVSRKRAGIIS
jgi:ATP-binding cassette subfamily E protein 1